MAVWAKLVEFFAEDDEVARELVRVFKEEYGGAAEPPFTCIGTKTCQFYLNEKMCPFIIPKEKEILAVSLIDVQRHESDGLVVIVGGGDKEVRTFVKKGGNVEWVKKTERREKYPVAEWFIDVFATEYLSVSPRRPRRGLGRGYRYFEE